MDNLIRAISQYPNGTDIIVEWGNGFTVMGEIDTIYETNNELDSDDKAYQEYYACLLYVSNVIGHKTANEQFSKGDFIEISMQKPPIRVRLKNGTIIWEQNMNK